MTVKDIAIAANVSHRTVSRTASRLFPGKMANGHRTTFSKDEAVKLMGELRKPGFVTVDEPGQHVQVPSQNGKVHVRAKLPNGKQMEVLYRAAKDKLMTPIQFQEAIGVTIPGHSRIDAPVPRLIEETPASAAQIEADLRSLMPAKVALAGSKIEAAAEGARSRASFREVSKLTQDRMNYHLPLGTS